MPANAVNLDALIPREDFDFVADQPARRLDPSSPIKASSLATGEPLYALLRKPDFQRETAIWTPEKIRDLVVAFVEEDLVPALILWRSPQNLLFVIDGAHRLSSLIAWVNDDYGDGGISRSYFGNDIPDAQRKAAEKTKKMVDLAVGEYHKVIAAFRDSSKASNKEKHVAEQLNYVSMVVQGLEGSSEKAERSFFKINEQGVSLNKTELTLLHSRRCPNSVAARAINHRGTGHRHWKGFLEAERIQIETLAKETAELLFDPPLVSTVLKTTEVPIAGKDRAAGALSLLLDTINLTNSLGDSFVPRNREEAEKKMPPDADGSATVSLLKRTRGRIAKISSGGEAGSLELHPFVYFYSDGGRHLPSSFLAIVEFLDFLDKQDKFKQFALVRESFEDYLIASRDYIPQLVRKARGEIKAVHLLSEYFRFCFEEFLKPNGNQQHVAAAIKKKYPYLKPSAFDSTDYGTNFSAEAKNKLFINHALEASMRCHVCKARVPNNGVSYDHKIDKKDGGTGDVVNIGPTHTYCNNSKDQLLKYFQGQNSK